MGKRELENEILEILILSHYEIETQGNRGSTAQEILNFRPRAFDKYTAASIFHARVERDTALIIDAIERHKEGKG